MRKRPFAQRIVMLFIWLILFNLSDSAFCHQQELQTESDLTETLNRFSGIYLFLGHGSKSQLKDLSSAEKEIDHLIRELDEKHGRGEWLAVFGGDGFNPEKPDIGAIMNYLSRQGTPVLAIQSDIVKQWGGVDSYIDFVHWIPTTQVPDIDAEGQPIMVDGRMKMKTLWGGFLNGAPVGPTSVYLGDLFIGEDSQLLSGVVAVGGGPIALEEVSYAHSQGIPVRYIQAETRFPEINGRFGSVHDWHHALETDASGVCLQLAKGTDSPEN